MPKKAKKTLSSCEDHYLSMKPKFHGCRFSQHLRVSFCNQSCGKHLSKTKKIHKMECLDCPKFNRDRNFATPTFILSSEKGYYEEKGQRMREEHEKKMINYSDEVQEMNVPKPRSKNNFCSVCKDVYEDYLEHIDSEKHKLAIRNSRFNPFILQLAERYNPSPKSFSSYSYNLLSTGVEDDVEIEHSRPRKIAKIENPYVEQNQYSYMREIPPPPHLNFNNFGLYPSFNPQLSFGVMGFPRNTSVPLPYNLNINFCLNPLGYPEWQMNNSLFPFYRPERMGYSIPPMHHFFQEQIGSPMNMNAWRQGSEEVGRDFQREGKGSPRKVVVIEDEQEEY